VGFFQPIDPQMHKKNSASTCMIDTFQKKTNPHRGNTVDGRNPANQLRRVLYIQTVVGLGISAPSTVPLGEL